MRLNLLIVSKFRVVSFLFIFMVTISWSSAVYGIFIPSAFLLYLVPLSLLFVLIIVFYNFDRLGLILFFLTLMPILFIANLHTIISPNVGDLLVYVSRLITFPLVVYICFLLFYRKGRDCGFLVELLTFIAVVSILACLISQVYALLGGEHLIEFQNPDGRSNRWYLFSGTNAFYGIGGGKVLIRAASIFDEPGAYSFFLIFTVILRTCLLKGKSDLKNNFILLMGFITTLSLTHFLIMILYYFLIGKKVNNLALVIFSVLIFAFLTTLVDLSSFTSRFEVSSDGSLKGNNRTAQISNFSNVVNRDIVLWGNLQCTEMNNCQLDGDISSSPVTPTYVNGLAGLMFQTTTHFFLIIAAILAFVYVKRPSYIIFVTIALSLLLLQRPYFFSKGYALMVFSSLFYIWYSLKNERY